ncbi:hypothetical protein J6590_043442 [Homalodisca vitripennis]|nr:hypothetical protein J6590_043442 [Homalodisca vitripennis]
MTDGGTRDNVDCGALARLISPPGTIWYRHCRRHGRRGALSKIHIITSPQVIVPFLALSTLLPLCSQPCHRYWSRREIAGPHYTGVASFGVICHPLLLVLIASFLATCGIVLEYLSPIDVPILCRSFRL